jgi:hypothetical protein
MSDTKNLMKRIMSMATISFRVGPCNISLNHKDMEKAFRFIDRLRSEREPTLTRQEILDEEERKTAYSKRDQQKINEVLERKSVAAAPAISNEPTVIDAEFEEVSVETKVDPSSDDDGA